MATTLKVSPTVANGCIGVTQDDDSVNWFKCKNVDGTKDCRTQRYFYVTCPHVNSMCSQLSGAYVAATTICGQRLY